MRINLRGLFIAVTAFAIMLGMWRMTYAALQSGYRYYTASDPSPRTLVQLIRLDLPRDIKARKDAAKRKTHSESYAMPFRL